jgi:hypothetical protein
MSVSHDVLSPIALERGNLPNEFFLAFQRLEPEIYAVPDAELLEIHLDVPVAVATVLKAWPQIELLGPELKRLPQLNTERFPKLRAYALALGHVHAVYRAATGPWEDVCELTEELSRQREILHADALALAKRVILDEATVNLLSSGLGYQNLAFDVARLVNLYCEHWSSVVGRTGVKPGELDAARRLAQQLVAQLGTCSSRVPQGTAKTRQRAFTLFMQAYDGVRRGVSFLRWQLGDSDSIAPSLFAARGKRSPVSDLEPEPG